MLDCHIFCDNKTFLKQTVVTHTVEVYIVVPEINKYLLHYF